MCEEGILRGNMNVPKVGSKLNSRYRSEPDWLANADGCNFWMIKYLAVFDECAFGVMEGFLAL